ncbi:MAG: hypothetical protein Ct9H300mP28_15620 [Pseudomonadota bacterium]|nr:MAG: hypothetical protein Ct9H300mP28_15620 [Pseudomonadota bacterium]
MLKPCSLLILDNVLSAVDYETERFLLQKIHKLFKTRKWDASPCREPSDCFTSSYINGTGRLDFGLDEGKIVDQGVHTDLIRSWLLSTDVGTKK